MAIFQRNFIIYLAIYARGTNSTFPQRTQTNVRIWQFLLWRSIGPIKVQASAKAAKRIERKQHARFAGFNSPARLRLRQTKPPSAPQARRRLDLLTSRTFERVARQWARSTIVRAPSAKRERAFVPDPTTPDQKTMRTTLRKSRRRLKVPTEIGSVSSLWCFDAPAVLSTEYRSRIETPKAEEWAYAVPDGIYEKNSQTRGQTIFFLWNCCLDFRLWSCKATVVV